MEDTLCKSMYQANGFMQSVPVVLLTYAARVADADCVHASGCHLHHPLGEGHQSRLLPLHDILSQSQLTHISLATEFQNLPAGALADRKSTRLNSSH